MRGPLWAPLSVDVMSSQLRPRPGWVVVEELVLPELTMGGVVISRPYDRHTVFGRVRALHPETAAILRIEVGDEIIYREWSGGRWALRDATVLIMPMESVLAVRGG